MQRFGATRWVAIAGVIVLVVLVGVLALIALQRANPQSSDGQAEPVPTFTLGVQTATPTPTSTPNTLRPEAVRSLAIGSEVWWRATAGACGGPAPLVERSDDQGATWTDVTPNYLGIAEVLTLDAFSGRDAELVAGMPGCEAQALRTYTRGEFWESYPDVLASSRYIDPNDAGSVRLPSGPVPAPCPAAWGLHAFGDIVTLVCGDRAWSWSGAEWVPLGVEAVVAVAIDGSDILVAHRTPDCAGVAVTRVSPATPDSAAPIGCAEGTDAATPVALAPSGDAVMVWVGDGLMRVG